MISDNHIGRISNGSTSVIDLEGYDSIHHDGNILRCLVSSLKDKPLGIAENLKYNDE